MLVVPATWVLRWLLTSRKNSNNGDNSFTPQRSQYPLPLTPLNGSLLLMTLMVLVSTWATYDIGLSLPNISGMVLGIGVFYAVFRETNTSRGMWICLNFLALMGLGVAGLGLVGTQWVTAKMGLWLDDIVGNLPGLVSGLPGVEQGFNPNEVAGALTWVLPLWLAFSVAMLFTKIRCRRKTAKLDHAQGNHPFQALIDVFGGLKLWQLWGYRIVIWLGSLFILGIFVLTQSRSAYIGVAATSLLIIFLALPRGWRWGLLSIFLVVGLTLGFMLSGEGLSQVRDWVVGSGVTTERALSLNTIEGRIEIWSRAIYGLQDFSFTGMGMNTFREFVHVIYPLFMTGSEKDFGDAHNEFLQAGLDLGIPGMIAFISLYIGTFLMLVRLWHEVSGSRYQGTGILKAIILGLGGGIFAHLLYGMTDAVALGAKPGLLFWMLLGLVAGMHNKLCLQVDVHPEIYGTHI